VKEKPAWLVVRTGLVATKAGQTGRQGAGITRLSRAKQDREEAIGTSPAESKNPDYLD
jgi:hypothetical protein